METSNTSQSKSRGNPSPSSEANGGGGSSLQSLGALLRERREAAGVGLAEVEKATRIRQKYILALEADEWHLLPGEVVGRGFLRNYANYLNLDPNSLMDRRRGMTDNTLARTLANTSAGTALPPARDVDYRPKDVDLEHTPMSTRFSEYVAAGQDWFAPIATAVSIILVIFVLWWGLRQIGGRVSSIFAGVPEQTSGLVASSDATPVTAQSDGTGGMVADSDTGDSGGDGSAAAATNPDSSAAMAVVPTSTPTRIPTNTPDVATQAPTATPTETSLPPTATYTPVPLPTATDTPVPIPTETPVPEASEETAPTSAPAVAAANCPDPRSVITSPGVNQVVSGVVPIVGTATHDQFDYYKLEFAPGADAGGGYGYFDGGQSAVPGGTLGNFSSTGVPNGTYTLQLTVVDTTGNYPEQCRVTIVVEN